MSCGRYDLMVLGRHERRCKKCGRETPRGQDILDPTPAPPEPPEKWGEPVVVKDIND